MGPAEQAVGVSLAVSLASSVTAFVLWRRRPDADGVAAAAAAPAPRELGDVTAPLEPPAAAFEWPPRDVELFRYWSTMGSGLESAARLMGASAMILWKADASGELVPVDAYGYPAGVSHADPLVADVRALADAAHQERCPRSRAMDGRWLVAVAVPVEHEGRVVGVLTAELRGDVGPPDAEVEAGFVRVAATLAPALAAGGLTDGAGVVVAASRLTRSGARRSDPHTPV